MGNTIFRREQVASPEDGGLNELVRAHRESLDNVIVGAEIMERPIGIAKDLERQRRGSYGLSIGFNPDVWLGSLDLHKVGHRAIGPTFSTGRDSVTAGEQTNGSQATGNNCCCFHGRLTFPVGDKFA